jgi:gliding motility-associated-like protein
MLMGASISTNIPGDYAVTAIGPNGCTSNAATFVSDNGVPPSISATSEAVTCDHPIATLVASSNDPSGVFVWSLPDGSSFTGAVLASNQIGEYTVVVMAQNGCTADFVTIVGEGFDPVLETTVVVSGPTCFGIEDGSITVGSTTGGMAPYSHSLILIGTGPTGFTNLASGSYALTTTDVNGCVGSLTIELVEPEEVVVSIGDDLNINLGESITLEMVASISPDSILWTGPDGQSWSGVSTLTLTPTSSGRYSIVISDVNSCRAADSMNVTINGEANVYLPTAFSPNKDGANDVFTVYSGSGIKQVVFLRVFDRWGEMVFEQFNFEPNNPQFGWDGKLDGRSMDPGLFVAKAEVEFLDGTRKVLKGEVYLVR